MELAKYKACICEGAAENAIMDILLDEELLVFSREEMLEESVIRCRDGKKFEQKGNRCAPRSYTSSATGIHGLYCSSSCILSLVAVVYRFTWNRMPDRRSTWPSMGRPGL